MKEELVPIEDILLLNAFSCAVETALELDGVALKEVLIATFGEERFIKGKRFLEENAEDFVCGEYKYVVISEEIIERDWLPEDTLNKEGYVYVEGRADYDDDDDYDYDE